MAGLRVNVTEKMKGRSGRAPKNMEADRAAMSKALPSAIDTEAQSNVKMNKVMSKGFRINKAEKGKK